MLLSDVQIRVKRTFGDEGGAQIEDADIARWASDAQLDIVRETKCNLTYTTLPVTAGVGVFFIPTSLSISSVTIDSLGLRAISLNELNQRYPDKALISVGTPEFFTARNGGVGQGQTIIDIYPPPVSNGTFTVHHNGRPLPVVNPSDSFSIPEQYQEIIFRRCLERAYELDGQWNAAKTLADDANNKTVIARADQQDSMDNSYPAIRCLPGDEG